MSPEPCHRASSTSAFSNSPESTAGRNLLNPVFVRISDFNRTRTKTSGRAVIPASASIIGRANNSKVTIVETGFPGSPKKYRLCGADTPVRVPAADAQSERTGVSALHEPNTTGPVSYTHLRAHET